MLPAGLIDTGAILATIEADDHWHSAWLEAQSVRIPLLTSEAVLNELFHLINIENIEKAWRFIRSGVRAADDRHRTASQRWLNCGSPRLFIALN
jgi:predicted nucleic acid-binding protein